jgi:hypothetical protein
VSGYRIVVDGSAPPWAHALEASLNNVLNRIATDMKPKRLAASSLPTDDSIRLAIVTGANRLAYWNGSSWRYASDDAAV